jgi:hypothetical protein
MADHQPNISDTGADRRRRAGNVFAGVWGAGVVASIALSLPSWARATLVVPAGLAALYLIQARRMTCVLRAGEGTFEGDDMSTTPAVPEAAAASRRVAAGIWRDTLLFATLGGAAAVATKLVR